LIFDLKRHPQHVRQEYGPHFENFHEYRGRK
jgi:hypothetical protein